MSHNCRVVPFHSEKKPQSKGAVNDAESEFLASQQARLKTLEDKRQLKGQHADAIHSFWERLRTNLGQWEAKLQALHEKESSGATDNAANTRESLQPEAEKENNKTTKPQNVNQQLLDLKLELQQLQKHCLGSVVVFEDWEVPVLPVADLRLLHNTFTKHLSRWEASKQEIAPKGKFVFRRYREEVARRNAAHQTIARSVTASDAGTSERKATSRQPTNEGALLQDLSNSSVVIAVDGSVRVDDNVISIQISDAALLVRNLKNCSLTILLKLVTLHIVDSTETKIVVQEPVGSAIHVTGCNACQLEASGQQLRLHDSIDLQCTVTIGAGAILEDCSGIVFCTTLADSLDVRDFNWLRSGESSPNYAITIRATAERDVTEEATRAITSEQDNSNDVGNATDYPASEKTMANNSIQQDDFCPTPTIKPSDDGSDDDDDEL